MSLGMLAMVALLSQSQFLAMSLYLHRSVSHESVVYRRAAEVIGRVLVFLTLGHNPEQWAAVHRRHHGVADTPDDPHSPVQEGVLPVWLLLPLYYRRGAAAVEPLPLTRTPVPVIDAIPGWAWPLGPLVLVLVGTPLLGVVPSALVVLTSLVIYSLQLGAVASFGHSFGTQPHVEVPGRDSRILAALTWGEGLHNSHHRWPGNADLAGEGHPRWADLGYPLCRAARQP